MTDLQLETYLADDQWLRRLARRLVSDPETAEDLAQEVWVRRLDQGRSRSRSWMGGVLRNVGRHHFRSRTRESRRIEAVAADRPVSSSSSAEVAAELELRERVASELLALEEPYRTAVHLVHVRGMTLTRAASEEGVALSTISDRATRGLERLRERLDRAFHGDRGRWTSAMAAIAVRPGAVAAKGLVARGAALVSAALVGGAVIVLAQGAIGGSSTGSAPTNDLAEVESVTSSTAGAVATIESSDARHAAPTTTPVVAAAQSDPALVVRIVRPEGEPAEGATWTLYGDTRDGSEWSPIEGLVPVDGWVRVPFDASAMQRLNFFVREEEVGIAQWRSSPGTLPSVSELGVVKLHPVTTFRGRVVDDTGAPILGREIRVSVHRDDGGVMVGRAFNTRNGVVDPMTGTFEIDDVPIGASRLLMRFGSWSRGRVDVDVRADAAEPLDVQAIGLAEALATIRVKLSGRPFAAVRTIEESAITIVGTDGSTSTPSRERPMGTDFLVTDLTAAAYDVFVDDPRFEPWSEESVAPGSMVRVRLVGRSGVRLRVLDPDGAEVTDFAADVEWIAPTGRRENWRVKEPADVLSDGLVGGLVAGDHRITVESAAGHATVQVPALGVGEVRSVEVVLAPAWQLTGSVRTSSLAPYPDIEVVLVVPASFEDSLDSTIVDNPSISSHPARLRELIGSVRSEADGSFEFDVREAGTYIVVARTARGAIAQSEVVTVGPESMLEPVEVIAPPLGNIGGRVRFPNHIDATGWTIQAEVVGKKAGPLHQDRRSFTSDGRFDLGPVSVGTIRLHLFQPNCPTMWSDGGITGSYLLDTFEHVDGEPVDRDFGWPDPSPLSVTFDVTVPEGFGDIESVALTGQPVQGQQPMARGKGPLIGPIYAAPLTYGVAVRGDGWVHWQRNVVAPSAGTAPIPIDVELERRSVRVLVGDELARGRVVRVRREDALHPFASLTTFDCDEEGVAEIVLSAERYEFVVAEPGPLGQTAATVQVEWPLPDGVDELRFD